MDSYTEFRRMMQGIDIEKNEEERIKKEAKKKEAKKKRAIGEMAQDIESCEIEIRFCDCMTIAKELYKKGYRKRQ